MSTSGLKRTKSSLHKARNTLVTKSRARYLLLSIKIWL
jgi:hypothetical protein